MPVEGAGIVVRVIVWLVMELLVDWLLEGTGRLILRSRRNPDPGAFSCVMVGTLFWIAVCVAVAYAWHVAA